jgi:LIVCS family branched-chain amino acid:cation transporter
LVALTFIRTKLANPQAAYRVVILVSLLFALIDAAKVSGLDVSFFNFLPLFDMGMGWLLPTVAAMIVMTFVGGSVKAELEQKTV